MLRPLVAAILLAGCVAGPVAPPQPFAPGEIRVVDVGVETYEPSVGLDGEGRIYVNGYEPGEGTQGAWGVWRSIDGGRRWDQAVDDADRPPGTADPWLWVDPETGRVFSADLLSAPACSWLVWSDDGGETWEKNVAAGCGAPAHHFQKLTSGPPPPGVATRGYPSVLYYSSTSLREPDPADPAGLLVGGTGTDVAVSLDGGATWSAGVRVHPPTPGGFSQAGPVAVGPDGTAWSPAQTDAGVRIARSTDAGATWELVAQLDDAGYQPYGADPSLVVDPMGALHLLHASRESLPVLRSSVDGRTWTSPRAIAPLEVRSTIFPLVRVLDDGALVAAYLGATDATAGADPSFAPPSTTWRLYLTLVEDPFGETRLASLVAEDDPLQRGCIWMRGGATGSECRNLGDFFGLAARDGLVAVAVADGCVACPAGEQSTSAAARVALWRPLRGL